MENAENQRSRIAKKRKVSRRAGRTRATVASRNTARHKEIIASYVARGFSTHGFVAAVATMAVGHSCRNRCRCEQEEPEEGQESTAFCQWSDFLEKSMDGKRLVPDAYRLDEEEGEVEIVEVDVTHHTSDEKLVGYGKLWQWLDNYDGYSVRVIVVDRFGVERHFDGMELAYNDSVFKVPISPWKAEMP